MLSQLIRQGLRDCDTTVSEVATKLGYPRSFLNKLKNGGHPPRTHRGETARQDPRYARIAEALDLDVKTFTATAEFEQCAPPLATPTQAGAFHEAMAEALDDRFERQPEVARHLGPTVDAYIDAGLVSFGVRRLAWRIRSLPPAPPVLQPKPRTTPGTRVPNRYLGVLASVKSPPRDGKDNALARAVSELCLTASDDIPGQLRVKIAGLFSDLASRKIQSWEQARKLALDLGPPAHRRSADAS